MFDMILNIIQRLGHNVQNKYVLCVHTALSVVFQYLALTPSISTASVWISARTVTTYITKTTTI